MCKKSVFILSLSSDIGRELAKKFLKDGFHVMGTYRTLNEAEKIEGVDYINCDIEDSKDIDELSRWFEKNKKNWDTFISAVGDLQPIGRFFDVEWDQWEKSLLVNSAYQLKVLHSLYKFRVTDRVSNVVFFAGGGVNSGFDCYSAYCASKLVLIKMCELLSEEYPETNFFISGTGWTKTKIHQATIEAGLAAEGNFDKTTQFLDKGIDGTSHQDIYDHISWGVSSDPGAISGRNYSIVHDDWRDGGERLIGKLKNDPDCFKMRRKGNNDLL